MHTNSLIDSFGHTFKPIEVLRRQLLDFETAEWTALAALLGEYDFRGQSGYQLTSLFFDWFSSRFDGAYSIDGPRGAGRDIELSSVFPDFDGSYPCDFVITRTADMAVVAVGFARYDSTRGGAQSDDRTGGNANKVEKARHYCDERGVDFKIIFLADGPDLLHSDTLSEAKELDDQWNGRVRVVTLKLAPDRITEEWFES